MIVIKKENSAFIIIIIKNQCHRSSSKPHPRRNKYISENILLNIFKFYISKYIIKFLQSHDSNKKKKIRLL